jgi:hypothetical protein
VDTNAYTNKQKKNIGSLDSNNMRFWEKLIAYFPRYDTNSMENDAFNTYFMAACVLLAAVTFSPSGCLAMFRNIFFLDFIYLFIANLQSTP